MNKHKILILATFFLISPPLFSRDLTGRLGLGLTNQLVNDVPSLSIKLQRSRNIALGVIAGFNMADTADGGFAAGVKLYRLIFDEPQLNFFGATTFAFLKDQVSATTSHTGFEIDFTLGTEFHFSGLESIGFSFEFGLSLNKLEDFVIQTVGSSFVVSAVHFYL